jgi:pimeloyl-ACP methyl ester carboxylesterase
MPLEAPRSLASALSLLARISPSAATEAASRLFLLVPRVPRPRGESARFLASGSRFSVRANGKSLAAWSWGDGPTVLLVHGWGGRGAQMRSFVPPLVAAGYRAVAFDGPAHGYSGGLSTSLPEFADAIAAVAKATGARGVVAHSLGGASTLLALAAGLPVERTVLLGAPSNAERVWRDWSAAFGLEDAVADAARRRIERRVGVNFAALNAASLAPRISTPVLVVHDREDAEVPWISGEEITSLLPSARLVATRGLGHRRILRDPAVVAHAVRFLADGIAPARCESCRRALGSAGTATLCGNCALGRELFDRRHRSAA